LKEKRFRTISTQGDEIGVERILQKCC